MELLKLTAIKPLLQQDLNAYAPKLQLQMRQPQLAVWDPKPLTLNLNDSYLGGRGSRLRPQLSASPARQHPNLSPKYVGTSKIRGTFKGDRGLVLGLYRGYIGAYKGL